MERVYKYVTLDNGTPNEAACKEDFCDDVVRRKGRDQHAAATQSDLAR